jgi:signal transduction histidine kinase
MKNQFQPDLSQDVPTITAEPIALHNLVNRVSTGLLPQATAKSSFIINEVDEKISVIADEDILAFVLGCLISNSVCSTSHSCIRVETISKGNSVQIVVKNNGKFDYIPGMHSLVTMSGAARKLGGIICLKTEPTGGFTVVLSLAAAA